MLFDHLYIKEGGLPNDLIRAIQEECAKNDLVCKLGGDSYGTWLDIYQTREVRTCVSVKHDSFGPILVNADYTLFSKNPYLSTPAIPPRVLAALEAVEARLYNLEPVPSRCSVM